MDDFNDVLLSVDINVETSEEAFSPFDLPEDLFIESFETIDLSFLENITSGDFEFSEMINISE